MKERIQSEGGDILHAMVSKALEIGADGLEIDYKDGHERIFAVQGALGVGIGALPSDSQEAAALRKQLRAMGKKGKTIEVRGAAYRLRVSIFDSFGEDAFRVEISAVSAGAAAARSVRAAPRRRR